MSSSIVPQLQAACSSRDLAALTRLVASRALHELQGADQRAAIRTLSTLSVDDSASLSAASIRARTLLQRGRAYLQLRRFDLACSDVRAATSLDAAFGEAFVELSIVLQLLGHADEAKQVREHALTMDPARTP